MNKEDTRRPSMGIQVNNIDPILIKEELKAAIKITNEGTSKSAMKNALLCMKAYKDALESQQRLTAMALGKIRELSSKNK